VIKYRRACKGLYSEVWSIKVKGDERVVGANKMEDEYEHCDVVYSLCWHDWTRYQVQKSQWRELLKLFSSFSYFVYLTFYENGISKCIFYSVSEHEPLSLFFFNFFSFSQGSRLETSIEGTEVLVKLHIQTPSYIYIFQFLILCCKKWQKMNATSHKAI
jgi:hypothetical protein